MKTQHTLAAFGLGLAALGVAGAVYAAPKDGKRFDRLDTNEDGVLTAEELAAPSVKLVENADTDGDGALSAEELETFRDAKRAERRAERDPDTNGDGVVDRIEFIEAAEKRFDRLDRDGDGVLAEDEQPRRGERGRHGRRGGR